MTSNIESFPDDKASRMMRKAILRELQCPPDAPDDPPPADNLEQVARALVRKAGQGDVAAIKEVLDRIDGKTLPGVPDADETPKEPIRRIYVSWKPPKLLSTTSPACISPPSTSGGSGSPAS
jgi:hypothetical protein